MSSVERKRRSRQLQQATGVREFQLQVQGIHLSYIEQLADVNTVSVTSVLHMLFERTLDRYVGMVRRSERMKENGASDEDVAAFMHTYFMPELPPMPEKNGQ